MGETQPSVLVNGRNEGHLKGRAFVGRLAILGWGGAKCHHPVERKLAAIFAADIAGYSRLMEHDEVGTLARSKACRAVVDDLIASHRDRMRRRVTRSPADRRRRGDT